jgi:hypothetical protein
MKNPLNLFEIQKIMAKAIQRSFFGELANIVCEKPPISIQKRLGIYRDAYEIRMTESMRDDFSRVEEKIGDEEFKRLAQIYIGKYPSRYTSLAEVSKHFPEFLCEISNELYELASLDWIEIQTHYAREIGSGSLLTAQEIASGTPFQLIRNPTLYTFKGAEISISFRSAEEIFVKTITQSEFEILELLKRPLMVDQFTADLEKIETSTLDVQMLISSWIKDEIIFCERTSL